MIELTKRGPCQGQSDTYSCPNGAHIENWGRGISMGQTTDKMAGHLLWMDVFTKFFSLFFFFQFTESASMKLSGFSQTTALYNTISFIVISSEKLAELNWSIYELELANHKTVTKYAFHYQELSFLWLWATNSYTWYTLLNEQVSVPLQSRSRVTPLANNIS